MSHAAPGRKKNSCPHEIPNSPMTVAAYRVPDLWQPVMTNLDSPMTVWAVRKQNNRRG